MAIIGIAGSKGAGKDSTARLITGLVMQNIKFINKFDMDNNGNLIVTLEQSNGNSVSYTTEILDLSRRDDGFMTFLYEMIWPHVKIYHFADSLKYILANLFQVDLNTLFGTQADKESLSKIQWESILPVLPKKPKNPKSGPMSHRELMQNFADIMRQIDENCLINYLLDEIKREQCPISIIADVRTEKEIDAINSVDGRIIYLTRREHDDKHHIENGLDKVDITKFDIVIDNQDMNIQEKNTKIINELKDRGFLQ